MCVYIGVFRIHKTLAMTLALARQSSQPFIYLFIYLFHDFQNRKNAMTDLGEKNKMQRDFSWDVYTLLHIINRQIKFYYWVF